MQIKTVFDEKYKYYDYWFEKHKKIYETEVRSIKKILPSFKNAIEIGVGTGRFAKPMGIKMGIEPSQNMAKIAKKKRHPSY